MGKARTLNVSRRERQIMDIIYRRGRASAAEVLEGLPDPPSYSAVRALLRILEEKGYVKHVKEGPRYIFLPIVARKAAARYALRHLVETFYEGSAEQAVAALLDISSAGLSEADLKRIAERIEAARQEGR